MLQITTLQNNPYFHKKELPKNTILFKEGDIDENIYVLISGTLKIYKTLNNSYEKLIAHLQTGDIFGERVLSGDTKKEVSIKAITSSKLLMIHKSDFPNFLKEHSSLSYNFLSEIIILSNKRLLESNELVIQNYKLNTIVSSVNNFSSASLQEVLSQRTSTLKIEYILFFEKNPVYNDYIHFRIDTRQKNKLGDEIIHKETLSLTNIKKTHKLSQYNYITELISNNKVIGYLVCGKKSSDFTELTKKIIDASSVSLAGFIRQKQIFEELK